MFDQYRNVFPSMIVHVQNSHDMLLFNDPIIIAQKLLDTSCDEVFCMAYVAMNVLNSNSYS